MYALCVQYRAEARKCCWLSSCFHARMFANAKVSLCICCCATIRTYYTLGLNTCFLRRKQDQVEYSLAGLPYHYRIRDAFMFMKGGRGLCPSHELLFHSFQVTRRWTRAPQWLGRVYMDDRAKKKAAFAHCINYGLGIRIFIFPRILDHYFEWDNSN